MYLIEHGSTYSVQNENLGLRIFSSAGTYTDRERRRNIEPNNQHVRNKIPIYQIISHRSNMSHNLSCFHRQTLFIYWNWSRHFVWHCGRKLSVYIFFGGCYFWFGFCAIISHYMYVFSIIFHFHLIHGKNVCVREKKCIRLFLRKMNYAIEQRKRKKRIWVFYFTKISNKLSECSLCALIQR